MSSSISLFAPELKLYVKSTRNVFEISTWLDIITCLTSSIVKAIDSLLSMFYPNVLQIDDDEAEKTSLFTHLTISGDKGREKEKEEGGEKTRQKGKEKEFLEPYDTVVVGPDGVGYVWTFRGKCELLLSRTACKDLYQSKLVVRVLQLS